MTDHKLNIFISRTALAWSVSELSARSLLGLPKNKSLRLNTLKKKSQDIIGIFAKDHIDLMPINWCKDSYEIANGYSNVSKHNLSNSGLYILQNQASFIPVVALDPMPSEEILDMCAAPGAKTSHIAALSFNKAKIIANDSSKNRFFKMRDLMMQYGVKVDTTMYDARYLHQKMNDKQFDKILLDAPCSGEADINPKDPKTYQTWSMAKVKRLSRLQEKLITVAFDLLKPGGTLVYSTCTISPEENEQIVAQLIKKRGAITLPIDLQIPDAQPGLTIWKDKALPSQLANTLRLLPNQHHEAFYIAKIQKPKNMVESSDTYIPKNKKF